jgi:hypothetical protein
VTDELPMQIAYPMLAGNAPRFADDFVQQALEQGIRLDYSGDSVGYVDSVIESLRANGVTVQQVADVLFGFGCYLGETVARATGGRWVTSTATPLEGESMFPIVLHLPSGLICDPTAAPFAALNGTGAPLVAFYERYAS